MLENIQRRPITSKHKNTIREKYCKIEIHKRARNKGRRNT
jgi:hypothetical protein